MPNTDPVKRRDTDREALRRKRAREAAIPKRTVESREIPVLRTLGDVLTQLESAVALVANDPLIDSATVARTKISAAKAAHEALGDHGLASDIADMRARIEALRGSSAVLVLPAGQSPLAIESQDVVELHARREP